MKAVIYARFSSEHQTEQSIDAQVRACEEYAERHGISIVGKYIDEAVSGKESATELRLDYQRMLNDIGKHKFDAILIHKYDRIARSMAEHVRLDDILKSEDITLIAVAQDYGDTNESKMMRGMTWLMSEYYIDNLAAETKKGLKETALKGLHNGGYPPFGYDVVERRYVINEQEAVYVRKMFDCALNRRGYTELIAEMKAVGITGKRGKPIESPAIHEILRNEKYTGVYIYSPDEEKNRANRRTKPNAIRIEGAIPAIIDKATFQEVQRIMDERKQTGRKADYLCSGLVYCANCGAKMHVNKSTRKGHTYIRYYCYDHCGAPTIPLDDVDTAAKTYIRELLSEDTRAKVAKAMREYKGSEKARVSDFKKAVSAKIAEKEAAYANLMANMSSAVLPAAVLEDIAAQMTKIKEEIAILQEAEPPVDYTADTIQTWLQSIRTAPDTKAVHLLIARIEAKKTEKSTDFNILSTLKPVLEKMVAGEGFEPPTSGL